ncbi:RidA family protein [Sinirhodobacter populi]|uniref:RidA family protein n=1 Tax=Paenirhodobacter populi TaxID=2306993 RepID=A0A443K0H5_9RHOB|nr:RidA family protein [Sinirhodobacter populi]RWR26191.1 RidA family protein [Sinirhodobacter populi]
MTDHPQGPFNPAGLKQQSYYNHAILRPGQPVFLTGQVAWDEAGEVVGIGDIDAQARRIWENIGHALKGLGVGPEAVVKLTTFAVSRDAIPALHRAREAFFAGYDLPASTFVMVAGLAEPELLAEIEATVMLPQG